MTFTDEQLQKAAEVLYRVVTDPQVKLEFGARKRMQTISAVERGENPQDYRTIWLKESRNKVVGFVQNLAAEFNRTYPHDACSVMDLLDVLGSAHHQFTNVIRKREAKKKAG